MELDGDGPDKALPLATALPDPHTLSHMCGFSVLWVFMCCVSLFCMGYTRPHTGQGKELSFGVWEGTMRGQRREGKQQGALTSCPTYHLQQSSPSQVRAPHSPDPASSF